MQLNAAHDRSPDPFSATATRLAHPPSCTPALKDQYHRRAEILAACRRILAEDSFDGFTIRRAAHECLVTPQTIHNCFGSRSILLASTLNEYTTMVYDAARANSTPATFFLELLENYAATAERYPDFMRAMMAAAFSSKRPLLGKMRDHGQALRRDWLAQVAAADCFRTEVDPISFGNQVCQITSCMMFEWAAGFIDIELLRREMLLSIQRKLGGALQSRHIAEVDHWMHREARAVAGAPRGYSASM